MDRKRKEVNDGSVKDFARMSKIDGQGDRTSKLEEDYTKLLIVKTPWLSI